MFDSDADNSITVSDFLMLISVFGDSDNDGDGLWDSADECDGIRDECGVCEGEGATTSFWDVTISLDSVYQSDLDEWYFVQQADSVLVFNCPCEGPIEYDGHYYDVVLIGGRCWFAENLKALHYRNGDAIPSNLTSNEWSFTKQGAVSTFGDGSGGCNNESPDVDLCDVEESLQHAGRLYNWWSVQDERRLCPHGWHVSSGSDWEDLIASLGGQESAAAAIQSNYGWMDYGGGIQNGTDEFGFFGFPAGRKGEDGAFYEGGMLGCWWLSSPSFEGRMNRLLYPGLLLSYQFDPRWGLSVRCVQNTSNTYD